MTRTVPTASFKAGKYHISGRNGTPHTLTPVSVRDIDPSIAARTAPARGDRASIPMCLHYFSQYPTANGSALGDGLNLASYTFSSPIPSTLNTSIPKLDYQLDRQSSPVHSRQSAEGHAGRRAAVSRAACIQLHRPTTPRALLPAGTGPSSPMINDLRYGYIRQGYADRGIGQGDYVDFRFMDQATRRRARRSSTFRCTTSSTP